MPDSTSPAIERPPTGLEAVLKRDRVPAAVLLGVAAASWAWIVVMARDMYGPMTGASAWMMTLRWDAWHVVLLWAMWTVMMAGMMLPSAAPFVLLYGAMARRSDQQSPAAVRIYALAAGYLAAWAAFSVGATVLQRVMASALLVTPMMEAGSSRVAGALLVLAGAYQLTPVKGACVTTCQSPLGFLMSRWRAGTAGAFRMGVEHGVHCVGCCWALMLLLFAGGVMNLTVILALTLVVAFEKLGPGGLFWTRVIGVALIAAGLWQLWV
jgi:predicted metal-binding membrane protein